MDRQQRALGHIFGLQHFRARSGVRRRGAFVQEGRIDVAGKNCAGANAVGALFREAVVGVGVYQGMEFILQRGMRDVAGKTGVIATRVACCGAGLARAKVWRLTLGRDHERNWEALAPLLR